MNLMLLKQFLKENTEKSIDMWERMIELIHTDISIINKICGINVKRTHLKTKIHHIIEEEFGEFIEIPMRVFNNFFSFFNDIIRNKYSTIFGIKI